MIHGNLRSPARFGLVLLLVLAVMVIPAMADPGNSSIPDASLTDADLTVIETTPMPPVMETATDVPATMDTFIPMLTPAAEVTEFPAPSVAETEVPAFTPTVEETNAAVSYSVVNTKDVTRVTDSTTGSGLANTPWPKWQHDLNNTGQSLFVGSHTGTPKWSFYTSATGSFTYSSPVIGSDGIIYIGASNKKFYAINPDGTQKWSYSSGLSAIQGTSVIGSDGTIYFGDYSNQNVYALTSNGSLKWKYTTGNKIYGSPTIGSDGTIYVGSDKFYALLHQDGSVKWSYPTGQIWYGSPAIGSDGTIYVGSTDTKVYALNPDGTQKWTYTTGVDIYGSPVIGADGTIYVGSTDTKIYALNPDGTQKWNYTTGGIIQGSPAIGADGTIYIGNYGDYKLYALNSDGTQKWNYTTGGAIYGSPVIGADGIIYFGNYGDKKVYALNPGGTLNWSYTIGSTSGAISGSPAIGVDGTLYIGTADKKLYAFPGVLTFTADQTAGPAPFAVQFTGTSDLTVTVWHWDFGDGTTSDEQNPSHEYTNGGSYTVNLTITHSNGSNSLVKTGYISAYSPPTAGFTSNTVAGKSPLSVTFTDQSTGVPTSWLWDFGDGTTATSQNPTHTFSTTGTDTVTYTVNLTATNSAGSNTTCKSGYITLYSNPPTVSFKATPRISTTVPLTVQFRDTSTLSPTSWLWDFGDGDITNATKQNPVHTYATAGTYTVNLTATNAVGQSTASRPGFITFVTPGLIPAQNDVNLYVANDEGVKYDVPNGVSDGTYNYIPNTYFHHMTGGLNAPSISDGTNDIITNTRNQSGTFWFAFAGGQTTMPDGILMLAVNGTIPDDFSVHIRSSGYNWTPPGPAMYNGGLPAEYNYIDGAVNQTFTKSDFIYGPQIWRPCSVGNYPLYNGQNMSNTEDTFQIMFIDLNAGAARGLPNNGNMIKIEFSFTNLTSFAAFDVYGWYLESNHGTGIQMTNNIQYSGYTVTGIRAAPVADFTSSSATTDILSPVQFMDTSANVPQSWHWDFGDGTTSTEQNPSHTYSSAGTYTVNLTVTNIKGTDTAVKTGYITRVISPTPVADFTVNATSGTTPLPVQFTDQSTGTVVIRTWDFSDGSTSTEQDPVHWYPYAGTYTVNLTVTNSGGSNSNVKNSYITTILPGSNRYSNPGFEIGGLTAWTTGLETSLSSTKTHSGNYAVYFPSGWISTVTYVAQTVNLTGVTNISFWGYEDGSSTGTQYFYTYIDRVLVRIDTFGSTNTWTQFTIPIYGYTGNHQVQINFDGNSVYLNAYIDDFVAEPGSSGGTPPTASFTATPVNGIAPLTVQFNDTSTGTPTSWLWDFGDANTSTEQNATHTYTTAGTYMVNLTVTSLAGGTSLVKPGYISVGSHSGALPNYTGIFVRAANPEGIRWNANLNGTYYINPNGGGLNAVHISTDPTVNAGQVTESRNLSGTFYATESGGRGYQDEVVLMLAVNGTLPDDFSVHIRTSGYTWMPNVTANTAPPSGAYTYQAIALDETFTKKDFCYGPQNWKPQGANAIYPIFYGEDLTSPVNENQLMFIDTRAGVLGPNHADYASLTDKGAVKVEYSFNNLSGYAAFNIYAWNNATTQGQGMGWTNRVSGDGSSGYSVITSSPIVAPIAAFTALPTTGTAPLAVTFTDASTNTPTSWAWDFGDGSTATTQNATHMYTTAGTFTVNLTVTNAAGSNSLVRDKYISVQEAPADRARIILPAASLYQNTATQLPVQVMNITNGTGISFDLAYDPAVIRVNEITLNQSYASGSNLVINQTDGRIRLALTRTDGINIGSPVPVFILNITSTGAVGLSTPLTLTNAMWGDGTFNYRTFNTMNGSALVYRYRGDLNGNTEVDIGDTAKTAYMVVKKTPDLIPDADFNNNGKIDVGDASKIAWYLVGKVLEL